MSISAGGGAQRLGVARVVGAAASTSAAWLLLRRARPERHLPEEPAWEPQVLRTLAGWEPARPRTPLGRTLAAVWAVPMTAAGLLGAATTGTRPRHSADGLLVTRARGPLAAMLRRRGFSAMTLGHVIIAVGEPSDALLAHERVHTRQAERFGPLFGPVYLVLLGAYGYRRHPFERAARMAGRRVADRADPPSV